MPVNSPVFKAPENFNFDEIDDEMFFESRVNIMTHKKALKTKEWETILKAYSKFY